MEINSLDRESYFSFIGLVKNNGWYKSIKQKGFFIRSYKHQQKENLSSRLVEEIDRYGVKLSPDQFAVEINYTNTWAEGLRAIVPGMFMFVFDEYGVVAQYKIRGDGNLSIGWLPNPEKTERMWKRESQEVPEYLKDSIEEVKELDTAFVGTLNERMIFEGTIQKITSWSGASYSYYDSGVRFRTTVKTPNGSTIVYFGAFANCSEGDHIRFSAKVTKHDVYEGRRQTIVQRPTKLEKISEKCA